MGRVKLARLRRILSVAIGLGIASAALLAAMRGLDWGALKAQIYRLDWRWLVIAVVFDIASYVAQGLRWQRLLKGASIWQTTRAIYAGLFLNEIVPLRPGEAVRAWLASRDLGVGIVAVAPTLVTERLMDAVWLAGSLLTTIAFVPLPVPLVRVSRIVIAVITLLIGIAVILGGTRSTLMRHICSGLFNLQAFLASGIFLLAQGLAFWAVTRASHLSVGIVAAFVVMIVVRVGTLIPAAPANLGTHQFSTILGLSLYGVPKAVAAAFSLVMFFILTAPLLTIGFAACVNAGLSWRSVRGMLRPDVDRAIPGIVSPAGPACSHA